MRLIVRLGVLVTLGIFAACSSSSSDDGTTDGPDASATDSGVADAKKDTGASSSDSGGSDSGNGLDAAAAKDAASDAKGDANSSDGGVDATVTDGSIDLDADGADGQITDAGMDSSSTDDSGSNDGSAPDAAPPDAAAPDAGCNDLSFGGFKSTQFINNGAPPAATGGTPGDGTYHLTSYTYYTSGVGSSGPGTNVLRSMVRIQGQHIDVIRDDGVTSLRASGTFVTTGSFIDITYSCSDGVLFESGTYTAGTGKFAFYPIPSVETVHSL